MGVEPEYAGGLKPCSQITLSNAGLSKLGI